MTSVDGRGNLVATRPQHCLGAGVDEQLRERSAPGAGTDDGGTGHADSGSCAVRGSWNTAGGVPPRSCASWPATARMMVSLASRSSSEVTGLSMYAD